MLSFFRACSEAASLQIFVGKLDGHQRVMLPKQLILSDNKENFIRGVLEFNSTPIFFDFASQRGSGSKLTQNKIQINPVFSTALLGMRSQMDS